MLSGVSWSVPANIHCASTGQPGSDGTKNGPRLASLNTSLHPHTILLSSFYLLDHQIKQFAGLSCFISIMLGSYLYPAILRFIHLQALNIRIFSAEAAQLHAFTSQDEQGQSFKIIQMLSLCC